MSDRPDISTLYLKKFLSESTQNSSNLHLSSLRSMNFRSRAICQHFTSRQIPMVRYVKITKSESPPSLHSVEPTNIKIRKCSSNSSKPNKLQIIQSVHLHPKHNQLYRQIMCVSPQEMSELQLSVGGQNRLFSLLQTFFQRRNKNKQSKKQVRISRGPTPTHPATCMEAPKQRISRRIDLQRRNKEKMIQSAIIDKQLQPWHIKDTDFGV